MTVLMPMLAAASSSSRMATQARPIRESWSRYRKMKATAMMTTTVTKYGHGFVNPKPFTPKSP